MIKQFVRKNLCDCKALTKLLANAYSTKMNLTPKGNFPRVLITGSKLKEKKLKIKILIFVYNRWIGSTGT